MKSFRKGSEVHARYYDLEGTREITRGFTNVGKTEFPNDIDLFSTNPLLKNWKIGECIAECYMEDEHGVRFHYIPNRDAKNPEGAVHGPDIVGFADLDGETVFVIGETKPLLTKTHHRASCMVPKE